MKPTLEIGKKFNELTAQEYSQYIEHHEKYVDFNTLGLYRSLLENEDLTMEEKIVIRDLAHTFFQKSFDFLQLKDPFTFLYVSTLGSTLTRQEELKWWDDIKVNQQRMLKDKRIRHRNFGVYSKHSCGQENCALNGLMISKDFLMRDGSNMQFQSDESHYKDSVQWRRYIYKEKKSRKTKNQDINKLLDEQ